ncbi:uncharacterized protein JCM6883_001316 [Sporobolomyces salmoneus]|uniref:uncharacterized protein n=1 Tax=Sporobolomyces salmoneus TaxID=183962 RepID=UPI003173FBF7
MADWTRTQARGFDPLQGLKWNAHTEVEFIKQLVKTREQLFVKHRRFNNRKSEAESWQALKQLAKIDPDSFHSCIDRYKDFCDAVNIPMVPLSKSSIALFLVAKCGYLNGNYKNLFRLLNRLWKVTSSLWKHQDGYSELEDSTKVQQAIRAFGEERKSIRVRLPKGKKASGIGRNTSPSASDDDFECSSDSDSDGNSSSDTDSASGFGGSGGSSRSELGEGGSGGVVSGPAIRQLVSSKLRKFTPKLRRLTRERVLQVVPNLPQVGDRFSSINELFIACYKAVIPVYGQAVTLVERKGTALLKCSRNRARYASSREGQCEWRIGAEIDSTTGEATVKQALSHFVHNHDPSPKILKNPSYRPPIVNPIIREAYGLTNLVSDRRPEKSTSEVPEDEIEPQKNLKLSVIKQDPEFPRPSKQSYSSSFVVSPSSPYAFDTKPFVSSSSRYLSRPTPSTSSDFLPQLEAFLKALDPSLVSLATPLYDAGIDSFDVLVLFSALESSTIDVFLEFMQNKAPETNQPISKVHLEMFGKLIKEAKEGGYNA